MDLQTMDIGLNYKESGIVAAYFYFDQQTHID
jgi:hypothetical protein